MRVIEAGRYAETGFTVRRRLFPESAVAALRDHGERLWTELSRDLAAPRLHWRGHPTAGRVADRLDPVMAFSEPFRQAAYHPDMVRLASDLLGAPAAPFKDKLIRKAPGVSGYALHQDFPYWADLGPGPESFVTLLLALDDADADNGAMELYPGLHRDLLPAAPWDPLDLDPAGLADVEAVLLELTAGDVLAFHSLTPHRSGPNRSQRHRRAYFVTYSLAAAGLKATDMTEALRAERYRALRRST
jgi:ectoine hydroxylase-related dioxygenase (phytanoyl-CoA dioxygenase family)